MLASLILFLSACSGVKETEGKSKSVTVAVDSFTGCFNPLYCENEGDKKISSLLFGKIRNIDKDNKPVNSLGSITNEFTSDGRVKYTVTLYDNIFFSDGTCVTADDLIFTYKILSDYSYDGVYSDFHLCDIDGMEAYYYDSYLYEADIRDFEAEAEKYEGEDKEKYAKKLLEEYINNNYSGSDHVGDISGIKKVDKRTVTVLCNSRDVNMEAALNVPILSKSYYGKEFTKGNTGKIKEINEPFGYGGYCLSKNEEGKITLTKNSFYCGECRADRVEIISLEKSGIGPAEALSQGKADIAILPANKENIGAISALKEIKSVYFYEDGYYSLFISSSVDIMLRRALCCLSDVNSEITAAIGTGYSALYMPLSIRNSEYPSDITGPYYSESEFSTYLLGYGGEKVSLKGGYVAGETDKIIIEAYAEKLKANGITLSLKEYETEGEMKKAVKSKKLDLCLLKIKDTGTVDKSSLLSGTGSDNFILLSDASLDAALSALSEAVGFADRRSIVNTTLKMVMDLAVECPICQMQNIFAYNQSDVTEGDAAYFRTFLTTL